MEPCLRLQQGVFNQCDCPTFSLCVCFHRSLLGGRGGAADDGSDRGGDGGGDDDDALAAALLTCFLALPPCVY